MADTDWVQVGLQATGAILSGATGLAVGVWKWGRGSARRENRAESAFNTKIDALRQEMRAAHTEGVNDFRETLAGLRQKINSVELEAERRFLPKDDFDDFRQEYRENTNRILDKLDIISRGS